jgi:N-acyl homoserine lactone hydrolase
MSELQDAVRRVDFGYFIRPASETGTGAARVEPVLGYLIACGDGFGLFDTGIGAGHDDLDAHYHPVRRPLGEALAVHGVRVDDVVWAANSHLHFDHCGGNPVLTGRPIFAQATELATAQGRDHYTLPELVAEGIRYDTIAGPAEIAPDVFLIPTPGHVGGHQSLVVRLADGTVICAGQSHDTASGFTSDVLARRAIVDGTKEPVPPPPAWMEVLLGWDPARVVFAHDLAVWEPT